MADPTFAKVVPMADWCGPVGGNPAPCLSCVPFVARGAATTRERPGYWDALPVQPQNCEFGDQRHVYATWRRFRRIDASGEIVLTTVHEARLHEPEFGYTSTNVQAFKLEGGGEVAFSGDPFSGTPYIYPTLTLRRYAYGILEGYINNDPNFYEETPPGPWGYDQPGASTQSVPTGVNSAWVGSFSTGNPFFIPVRRSPDDNETHRRCQIESTPTRSAIKAMSGSGVHEVRNSSGVLTDRYTYTATGEIALEVSEELTVEDWIAELAASIANPNIWPAGVIDGSGLAGGSINQIANLNAATPRYPDAYNVGIVMSFRHLRFLIPDSVAPNQTWRVALLIEKRKGLPGWVEAFTSAGTPNSFDTETLTLEDEISAPVDPLGSLAQADASWALIGWTWGTIALNSAQTVATHTRRSRVRLGFAPGTRSVAITFRLRRLESKPGSPTVETFAELTTAIQPDGLNLTAEVWVAPPDNLTTVTISVVWVRDAEGSNVTGWSWITKTRDGQWGIRQLDHASLQAGSRFFRRARLVKSTSITPNYGYGDDPGAPEVDDYMLRVRNQAAYALVASITQTQEWVREWSWTRNNAAAWGWGDGGWRLVAAAGEMTESPAQPNPMGEGGAFSWQNRVSGDSLCAPTVALLNLPLAPGSISAGGTGGWSVSATSVSRARSFHYYTPHVSIFGEHAGSAPSGNAAYVPLAEQLGEPEYERVELTTSKVTRTGLNPFTGQTGSFDYQETPPILLLAQERGTQVRIADVVITPA